MINNPGVQVDVENDEIIFDGEKVTYKEFIYLMLNKPDGYISATFDKRDPIVLDLIDKEDLVFEPFPVGRLDKDTEGLLIITNDGELAHRLLSPKHHVDKTYEADVKGKLPDSCVEMFAEGLVVDSSFTAMPAILNIISYDAFTDTSHIRITIKEGKYHQIKRMFNAVDSEVLYLKRLSMGSIVLDKALKTGEYRALTDAEISALKDF